MLPRNAAERSRALIDAMIESAPDGESRRILTAQLGAYGIDALSLVHNHGTRIIVLPRGISADEAHRKFHMDEERTAELKGGTGGLYDTVQNTIYLREDMIGDGLSSRVSASISRHEFAHALEDALGKETDASALYLAAKKGDGGRLISSYAGKDSSEYFAESVAAYLSPERDFTQSHSFAGRLLARPAEWFSGFEPHTREELRERDPKAHAMISGLLRDGVKSKKTSLRRSKGSPGYEAWLWRAHQVNPDDSKIRIALMGLQKSQAGDVTSRAALEKQIQAEYDRVEGKLLDDLLRQPGSMKSAFGLFDHYFERGGRTKEPEELARYEERSLRVANLHMQRKMKELTAPDGTLDQRKKFNAIQDLEYLGNQFREHGFARAESLVRNTVEGLLRQR